MADRRTAKDASVPEGGETLSPWGDQGGETLFEKLPMPLLALDDRGLVEACNEAFERRFGFTPADLIGKDPDELMTPASLRKEARLFRQRAMLGRQVRHETRRHTAGGPDVDVELQWIPRRVGAEVRGFFLLCRDLSEVRDLEEKLRQAEKMEAIGHLTGGIAHDFSNLLTAILGYAEMLELALADKPAFKRNAHEIRRAAERASQLTNRLLAFSRKQDVMPNYLHLNSVILEVEGMLRRVLGEKVRIETRLDVDLGLIWIDRVQLEQVILNLVVNARDAMPEGGDLVIETCSVDLDDDGAEQHPACTPGAYVALQVSDSGCGMDESTLEHMFEPYFTTKEPGKGTGLGLASVYGIVSQNGGYVRVESELGKGSLFEVALPRAQSPHGELVIDASGKIEFGRETILLVEDDTQVREVTRDYLRMSGYRVLEAAGEGEALAVLDQHGDPVHLLVTDVVMPDTSGPELARKLTRLRPEMKVLYQSGYPDNEVLRQGGPEPGWGYLQKPVRQKVMTQKVREILDG